MTQKILIVDDEEDLRKLLDFNLRAMGFEVVQASSGEEALALVEEVGPNLVIQDLMLPGMQGTEVCRRLKQNPATSHIPVLILSARGEEIDRVVGFEIGADDYVVKPFSVRELTLRVRAILKRAAQAEEERAEESVIDTKELHFGPLRIDQVRHRAWLREEELNLTALEFKLLATFVQRRGRVQTREGLLDDVWGIDVGVTTRTVDTHVKRLREKLGEVAHFLETVRGVGYRFAETPEHD